MIYFDLMCITPHGDLPVTIKVQSFVKKNYLFFSGLHLHVSYGQIFFPVVYLSKLATCPCVEHAHQTSSTLPVWHMHARHVQWHPHNKLATERINFLVHYSTDVCFNVFLHGTPSFPTKKQTQASGNCSTLNQNIQRHKAFG